MSTETYDNNLAVGKPVAMAHTIHSDTHIFRGRDKDVQCYAFPKTKTKLELWCQVVKLKSMSTGHTSNPSQTVWGGGLLVKHAFMCAQLL